MPRRRAPRGPRSVARCSFGQARASTSGGCRCSSSGGPRTHGSGPRRGCRSHPRPHHSTWGPCRSRIRRRELREQRSDPHPGRIGGPAVAETTSVTARDDAIARRRWPVLKVRVMELRGRLSSGSRRGQGDGSRPTRRRTTEDLEHPLHRRPVGYAVSRLKLSVLPRRHAEEPRGATDAEAVPLAIVLEHPWKRSE
jgi:hypothetical protein